MLIAHYVSCTKMYINLGWFGCGSALIFQEMVNYFRGSSLCQLSCICMAHHHPTEVTQMTPQNHQVTRPIRASSHVYFKEKFLLEVTGTKAHGVSPFPVFTSEHLLMGLFPWEPLGFGGRWRYLQFSSVAA